MTKPLTSRFFTRDVDVVAKDLIGSFLTVGGVGGLIVETESYDSGDPASHAYELRRTPRNAAMFGAPGHVYVYRIYGIHWCLNFVCGDASAVLIRALEPRAGIAKMQARRGTDIVQNLCSGPGKLCQALGITGTQNGLSLFAPPFALRRATAPVELVSGVRIGITKAADRVRRFGLAQSPFLSRRFPEGKP